MYSKRVDDCSVELDGVQQYTWLETVEFGNILNEGNAQSPEDCYEVIKQFCEQYLNISVKRYDISIAHRQFNLLRNGNMARITFLPYMLNS